jgi:ABC-type transporter Mla maintaining outer membrane lipid asymmetry ATPase subunit MlaF
MSDVPKIRLRGLKKSFGDKQVLDGTSMSTWTCRPEPPWW